MNRWRFETAQRYYEIALEKDLFGEWILARYWPAIGAGRGVLVLDKKVSG